MNHKLYKITSVKVVAPFQLEIGFDDGNKKENQFFKNTEGRNVWPLADESFFRKVYLDKEVHTIAWPNGADFDPEILYNWETYKDELIKRSEMWV